jgi:uncharacterized protein YcbX
VSDVVKVAGLYRYPVQSVQGEEVTTLAFGPRGVPGDRGFSIADLERNVVAHVSAARKNYRVLFNWHARYVTEPGLESEVPVIEIDFADGTKMRSDDAGIDRAISDRLEIPAALVRNNGSRIPMLFESSPCHLLTTATLKRLQQEHETGIFVPSRFRPNIFLDAGDTIGFIEQEWLGQEARIGGVIFDINDVCKRCALTTRAQGDLPDDPGILHSTVANKTIAGVYGNVVKAGSVKVGDEVKVSS